MATAEIVEQAVSGRQVDASETKDRRRAKAIVSEALRKAGSPLDNRGLSQYVLPGLWNAAMNVVIACFEPDLALALLADRYRGIVGHGDNADSPPRTVPAKGMDAYCTKVSEAGATIMESLETAMGRLEAEGLDDRFPETVFDSTLSVLLRAWGPDHARRAIDEQSALFLRGVFEPLNFMEPVNLIPSPSQAHKPEAVSETAVAREPAAVPAEDATRLPLRRMQASRRVEAWIFADTPGDGRGAFAVFMRVYGDEVNEERLLYGLHPDPNGRAAWLKALHECVLAICAGTERVEARIDIWNDQIARAAGNAPGTRIASEEALWNDIDAAMASHDIQVSYFTGGLSRDEMEKCDRKVNDLLDKG